ncbi:MAG: four helix bundle protein [Bacteroidaceae bacterium]|nr:four helix bundle protein [Bacteroidaceae bacterium]
MEVIPTYNFTQVVAWQKAHAFVLLVYKLTANFPNTEKYGLCSQFQRAAISIAANIAEGYKKKSSSDKLRFYNISQGSIEECRYYIILSKDLKYITEQEQIELIDSLEETSKLLNAYCKGVLTVHD